MYNFTELKAEVGKLCQRSGDADYLLKIGTWLNLGHDYLAKIYDYYPELQAMHNFSSVDGREDYPLPNDFDKPFRIKDVTNNKDIPIITEEEYVDSNVANVADSTEGEPEQARIYGVRGITGVLATAGSIIEVKSSSASDTAVVIRIEGYLDSTKLILGFENITVTGTTYVSGSTTFYEIVHISKDKDSVGYITIADSTPTVVAYMMDIDRVLRHKVLKLGLIPDDAYDYRVWYKRKYRKMVNAYDYAFTDADNYLILDAWGWALTQEKESVDRATAVWAKALQALQVIIQNVQGSLGPEYQHKIKASFLQAHRM